METIMNSNMQIQSTAGAVAVKNEKGQLSMQKVKVHRYVSGKRPDYAPVSSSEEGSDEEDFTEVNRLLLNSNRAVMHLTDNMLSHSDDICGDPRLRRLQAALEKEEGEMAEVHRIELDDSDEAANEDEPIGRYEDMATTDEVINAKQEQEKTDEEEEEEEEDVEEELSDSEIERRRMALKEKLRDRRDEVDILDTEDEEEVQKTSESSDTETSESEELSDTENSHCPRLKPVFIRKTDRTTILDEERRANLSKQAEAQAKEAAERRRRDTLKLVEMEILKERFYQNAKEPSLNDVLTDDENDEVEYELWKLRELKRIKRDKEEREQLVKEQIEINQLRNMTEEERRIDFRLNPKMITNKAVKGKYKFLQKYYHRGSYYLDEEDDLYRRDFSAPTLEDQFDKTVLPKVMQVKNFGRSGRTKYTHLVDQDTTQFDSPWVMETALNLKFHASLASGMKQCFEKPSRCKPTE